MAGADAALMAFMAFTSVASGAYAMTQGDKTPKMPQPAEPAPDTSQVAAEAQANALLKRKGAAASILTNPMQGSPSTARQTLGA